MNRGLHIVVIAMLLALTGCANTGYYLQSIHGQLDIWNRERPIGEVITDPATPQERREKLATVLRVREFASRELGLPDNDSYRRYADLGRPFVVWNVFATPEFSTRPVQWCFPFAGCVGYRGYFDQADARRFAAELAAEGHDVFVGGVPAYSTLGWFADPVLNTFIRNPDPGIARLIFHELAHQVLYVKNDSVFNESFAVTVEQEGVRRWLERHGSAQDKSTYEDMQQRRNAFIQLVQTYRERLDALYDSGIAPGTMRADKQQIFEAMLRDYERLKASWGGFKGYDRWFARKPSNALIASVAIYTRRVPAFQALLRTQGGDLPAFYRAVRELAALPREERDARLRQLAGAVPAANADRRP